MVKVLSSPNQSMILRCENSFHMVNALKKRAKLRVVALVPRIGKSTEHQAVDMIEAGNTLSIYIYIYGQVVVSFYCKTSKLVFIAA